MNHFIFYFLDVLLNSMFLQEFYKEISNFHATPANVVQELT